LTVFDYEILEKVATSSPIEEAELIKTFPDQSVVKLRIDLLSKSDYEISVGHRFPIPDTSYIEGIYDQRLDEFGANTFVYTGKLQITSLGLKALEEWHLHKIKSHRKLQEERAWKFISLLALIVAIISLLQSLHWIHLEKSELLSTSQIQQDAEYNSSTQPLQSP
jgi:hypothetical protein